jgi:hypothetical protein
MKTRHAVRFSLVALILLTACSRHCCDDRRDDCYYDHTSPQVPYGVYTVTGDNWVKVYWEPVSDRDLSTYGVYWNDTASGYYERIAMTDATSYTVNGLVNGETYYFAVDAWDLCGNSSDLSYETVFDTPRPAGYGLRLWEASEFPDEAGIDFSEYSYGTQGMIVPWDDPYADVYLESEGNRLFLTATADDTDLLFWGYAETLDDIDYAPDTGWISGGSLLISQSNAYLVWTWDNHFAKVLVTREQNDNITLDWAYQIDEGNPELCPAGVSGAQAWLPTKSRQRETGRMGKE